MSKRIKGITIEIDGNTKGLDKALGNVSKQSTNLQKELRDVEKLLKFDPGNTEAIAQKQKILADQISNTAEKLNTLKDAQKQVKEQFDKNQISEEQYRNFNREIEYTEASLKKFENSLASLKSEEAKQGDSLKDLQRLFQLTGKNITDFSDVIGNDMVKAIQNGKASSSDLDSSFKKISSSALGAGKDIDKIKDALIRLDSGDSAGKVKQEIDSIGDASDKSKKSVSGLGSEIASLAAGAAAVVGVGSAIEKALDLKSLDTKIDITFDVDTSGKKEVRQAVYDIQAYGIDGQDALESLRRQFALNADASKESNIEIVKGAAAITRAYDGVDITELVQEINEIGSELKITDKEALELVNDLLAIGFPPDQIDIIAEYGSQLNRAGFEAKEVKAILASAVATGSWNIDSLLDGLKEGRIRAAEMGAGISSGMKDSLRAALNTTKAASEEQLSVMRNNFDSQERSLEKSLSSRENSISKSYEKQKKAVSEAHEAEYESAEKSYSQQEKALEKKLDAEYDKTAKNYERVESNLEKSFDKQEKALEKKLDAEYDKTVKNYDRLESSLEKSLEKEMKAFEKASAKKIALIDKEYNEKLKLVDEEKYKKIKAIDSQIKNINDTADAEAKATEKRENDQKISELRIAISQAKTVEQRAAAQKELADFEEKLRQDKIKADREATLEDLKTQKEVINDAYDAKKEKLEAELEKKKESAEASIKLELEALRKVQDSRKQKLSEEIEDKKKVAQESIKAELEALSEVQEARREKLDQQKENELKSLQERNQAELEGYREVVSSRLDNLKDQQEAEEEALAERLDNQLDSVREAHSQELESFKVMNSQKLELAKNPPDSKAFVEMEKQLETWGKAIAQGGEKGSKAFKEMVSWLNSIEDETTRNIIGTELFGTMWEDQGENLVKIFTGLDDAQTKLDTNTKNLGDSVKKIDADPMVMLQKAAGDLIVALEPLLTVVAEIVAAIADFAIKNPKLVSTFVAIAAAVGGFIAIAVTLAPIITAITGVMGALGIGLTAALGPIALVAAAVVGIIALAAAIILNWEPITEFFSDLWTKIKEVFTSFGGTIATYVQENWKSILAFITGPIGQAVKFVYDNFDTIKKFISDFGQKIATYVQENWKSILAFITGPIGQAVKFVYDHWEQIKSKTTESFTKVRDTIDNVVTFIKNLFGNLSIKFKALSTETFTSAREKISGVISAIKNWFSNLSLKFPELSTDMFARARDAIFGILERIKSFFQNLDLSFPSITMPKLPHFSLNGSFSLDPPSVPSLEIDWYKKGGVFAGPSIIGVGEEPGVSEAVIPLKQSVLSKIGEGIADSLNVMGGSGITIQSMTVRNDNDIREIAQQLHKLQQRDGRGRG